jgi:uncharacterized protein
MDTATLLERFGEPTVLGAGGLVIGLLFGLLAQRTSFCFRAAVLECCRGQPAEKLAVWLLAFASALIGVQVLILSGALDVSAARQLASQGSVSGALMGGLMFGLGMVMTRGCASRLIILSAHGNLRALLSGLVFAVVAQASLSGVLAPARTEVAQWWTIDGGASRDLLAVFGLGNGGGLAWGGLLMLVALFFVYRSGVGGGKAWKWMGAAATGGVVALAWWFTYVVSAVSFEVVPVEGLSFSGPSAEWLMRVLANPSAPIGFDSILLPGVFLGAVLGAWIGRDWKIEGFQDGLSMVRYIAGAILMGFGAILAGGCAVGAGVSGGAVFALTAWLSLFAMWVGAALADRWLDRADRSSPV